MIISCPELTLVHSVLGWEHLFKSVSKENNCYAIKFLLCEYDHTRVSDGWFIFEFPCSLYVYIRRLTFRSILVVIFCALIYG